MRYHITLAINFADALNTKKKGSIYQIYRKNKKLGYVALEK